jgi:hypothetical protein
MAATISAMELRTGKVIQGAIVLDDEDELEEGASVAVWIGNPSMPVRATDEELELVREGQAAARRGELLDARSFLRELRRATRCSSCTSTANSVLRLLPNRGRRRSG